MDLLSATNVFVFALIQTVVFLLLIRFLDLYEREPLSILALLALWGAVGATFLSTRRTSSIPAPTKCPVAPLGTRPRPKIGNRGRERRGNEGSKGG